MDPVPADTPFAPTRYERDPTFRYDIGLLAKDCAKGINLERIAPGRGLRLALVGLGVCLCATLGHASDPPSRGRALWVRLTSPVSSYSAHPGDPVHAILTEEVQYDGEVVLPVGTRVDGVVRSVHKVGWGIRHETAALRLEFNQAVTPQGGSVSISTTVAEVENAREEVKRGVIDGVCSSDTPQGRITSRYKYLPKLNPYPDVGLIAFKVAFPIFPEPEIYLPSGTDLRLKLETDLSALTPLGPPAANPVDVAEQVQLEHLAQSIPQHTTTSSMVDADLVNLAFLGSREQVESAFRHAGWNSSDAYSKRAFLNNFYAFLNDSGYAQAPMRPLLLDGKLPDMNFQKSLNSYAKRDHLRIWQWPGSEEGEPVWLSSSTHDTGATLSVKYHRFLHHIYPYIDEERSKVIRDLSLAGCVKSVSFVPRPSVPGFSQNAIGDLVRTDGELAVLQLQNCQPTIPGMVTTVSDPRFKPGNKAFRYIRREILTLRSDIWRANIIYGAYQLGSMAVEAFRHHPVVVLHCLPLLVKFQRRSLKQGVIQRAESLVIGWA